MYAVATDNSRHFQHTVLEVGARIHPTHHRILRAHEVRVDAADATARHDELGAQEQLHRQPSNAARVAVRQRPRPAADVEQRHARRVAVQRKIKVRKAPPRPLQQRPVSPHRVACTSASSLRGTDNVQVHAPSHDGTIVQDVLLAVEL
jgi:hypothetical protein